MIWILIIIGVIVLGGLFNPWTGLFGNTLYSSKFQQEPEIKIKHKSFHLTKGHSGWFV